MKSAEVHIGGVYWATVNGKKVKVKIVKEYIKTGWVPAGKWGSSPPATENMGGWDVENLETGRTIHILSGRRLTEIGG